MRLSLRTRPSLVPILLTAGWCCSGWGVAPCQARERPPNILIVTIDTLRADRLSAYGYGRPTTPRLDALLSSGVRFTQARTVEPLTGPSLTSMLTALEPHEHAATRNGLRMRSGLWSLPKLLAQGSYRTAALVGNWTLKDKLSGLAEHFDSYEEVLTRKRWLGLFKGEATGEDLTSAATAWLEEHVNEEGSRPFLLWVHYVEPHAPYRLQEGFASRLGIATEETVGKSDRYDTEVAFVDHQVGLLLSALERLLPGKPALVVFAADHGESLGEHGDWGHGRNLYEPNLKIPMGLAWPGHIPAGRVIDAPALITDVTPTVLGLLGLSVPSAVHGFDWAPVLVGGAPPPLDRLTTHQAHKGAVLAGEGRNTRANGLLEVAIFSRGVKEVFRPGAGPRRQFDLRTDPEERKPFGLAPEPSPELLAWFERVRQSLKAIGDLPDTVLDPESVEQLKALGYLE